MVAAFKGNGSAHVYIVRAFNDYFTGINKEDIFIAISFLVNVSKPSHPNHLAKDLVSIWFSNENKVLKNKNLSSA